MNCEHGRPAGALCTKCQGCYCVADAACAVHGGGDLQRPTRERVARHLRWAASDQTISEEARMVLETQASVVERGDLCAMSAADWREP